MHRRSALKLLAAELAIDLMIKRLQGLHADRLTTDSAWGITRTLHHITRSIDYSIVGFPESKSSTFQNTAGRIAFSVFQSAGRMTHNLVDPIPGESNMPESLTAAQALRGLIESLERFDQHDDELQPHFAYGALSKSEYADAHAMHINNHFEQMRVV